MPYVNIKITDEPKATREQKTALIAGVTEILRVTLDKDPAPTFVLIDEVKVEDWGVGVEPVDKFRESRRIDAGATVLGDHD